MSPNKRHRPTSRSSVHSRKRKHAALQACMKRWNKPSLTSTCTQQPAATLPRGGCRIANIASIKQGIENCSRHSAVCGGVCSVSHEERTGLASILVTNCGKCGENLELPTSTKVKGEKRAKWEVNVGAVMGQMSTGGGHERLNEVLSMMNVPGMSKNMYLRTENKIGEAWADILAEEIRQGGIEEKQLAIERNEYHEGVPAIRVTVDGGWSKRSHKHSYNAKSGMAVIIGNATNKILYLGVRNKYCSVCAIAERRGQDTTNHKCFKNWEGSSSAMEYDILVKGFCKAEEMHGVRYMWLLGDGDSSAIANIRAKGPHWGKDVQKEECCNHSLKNYRTRLENIVKDFPKFKGKGNLTKRAIKRLTVGARCAIKMHSKTGNVTQLRKDLRNGPSHVFNDHTKCSTSFCKVAMEASNQAVVNEQMEIVQEVESDAPLESETELESEVELGRETEIESEVELGSETVLESAAMHALLESEVEDAPLEVPLESKAESESKAEPESEEKLESEKEPESMTTCTQLESERELECGSEQASEGWNSASAGEQEHESNEKEPEIEIDARSSDNTLNRTDVPDDLFFRIKHAGDKLVTQAPKLIRHSTTNAAECLMSVRCKFDGGKYYNRIQRGSFQHRCQGAGLRYQLGPDWPTKVWPVIAGSEPGTQMQHHFQKRAHNLQKKQERKQSEYYKKTRIEAKYGKSQQQDDSAEAQHSYGQNALQPDLSTTDLNKLCEEFKADLNVTATQANEIEEATRKQADDETGQWREVRRNRLTASNFHRVICRRKMEVGPLVKSLLYPPSIAIGQKAAVRYGRENEESARAAYTPYMQRNGHPNIKVTPAGFVIHPQNGWLGASPDNWVNDPDNTSSTTGLAEYKCPYTARDMTPQEAAEKKLRDFCLETVQGVTRLKRKHKFFHQVQGQMAVTGKPWCDFVVWTPHGLHVERIQYEQLTWEQKMFPKLEKFFNEAVLPELAAPRHCQGQPIREPWINAM